MDQLLGFNPKKDLSKIFVIKAKSNQTITKNIFIYSPKNTNKLKAFTKQPRHIPQTPIPFPQQLRLANFHQ